MKYPHLIILYGRFGDKPHDKQQAMIDGNSVCGYRDYARKFGEIIYLCPQNTKETWDSDIGFFNNDKARIVNKIRDWHPDSIVWSVKHDPTHEKDELLEQLSNKKVYYSCCSLNTINEHCDISLVDTPGRIKDNAILWVKGKDPEYWKSQNNKKFYDYIFVGKRGDKNEVFFLNELTEKVKEKRTVVWVGGLKHKAKINKSHHDYILTPFLCKNSVREFIDQSKVGIILSEIPAEGFPQTFLEMTMMGVPVVYMGPMNDKYFKIDNCRIIKNKAESIKAAEVLSCSVMMGYPHSTFCRQHALENFSLEKSYESILKGLGYDN